MKKDLLFSDFEGVDPSSSYDAAEPTMSDREILYHIWTKYSDAGPDSELERFPDYCLLMERYPNEALWEVLYLYRRIIEGTLEDSRLVPDILNRVDKISKAEDEAVHNSAKYLASLLLLRTKQEELAAEKLVTSFLLKKFQSFGESEEEARVLLDQLEKDALLRGHALTERGGRLGVPEPTQASSLADKSYAELKTQFSTSKIVDYRVDCRVEVGDRVNHAKFGEGFVTRREPGKAYIVFADAARTLRVG